MVHEAAYNGHTHVLVLPKLGDAFGPENELKPR